MANVLVIDDSNSLRATIVFTLSKSSGQYMVTEAESGAAALKLIEQRRNIGLPAFDLLLVDINMPPGMDGYDTVDSIRKMSDYAKVPILFLTAENTDEAKQHGRAVHANGWITKPFRPEVLIETINRVIGK